MEEKVRKKPAPKAKPEEAKPKTAGARKLRKGIFRLDFKKGVEPLPAEVTGPIVGLFPRTQYSYEIIWLEEEPTDESPPTETSP